MEKRPAAGVSRRARELPIADGTPETEKDRPFSNTEGFCI